MKDCRIDVCQGDNRIRNCQCYRQALGSMYDQFCAYEENGFLVPCNKGCCNDGKGCPGQCDGAIDSPPYKSDVGLKKLSEADVNIERTVNLLIFLIIALIILSTLLLLISGLKNNDIKLTEQIKWPKQTMSLFPSLQPSAPK